MDKGKRGAGARPAATARARAVKSEASAGAAAKAERAIVAVEVAASSVGTVTKPARAARLTPVAWSEEREAIFLDVLAQTLNVTAAQRASGLSSATIYRRRDASDTFRAAWATALKHAYVRLETELLGRALNGRRKAVWHGGRKVGAVTELSDRLALSLLARNHETCRGSTPVVPPQAEARVVLIEALARMNRGMGGRG